MKDYIKIYSHPRSGTHFLEAFLAKNFYDKEDLSSNGSIHYGHWSNKILLEEGEPYHKLFGSHFFPDKTKVFNKSIYIYRDGRAVIASLWRTEFYNKEWKGMTFSEFLRKDLDWYGGPGQKAEPNLNIVQHWFNHIEAWENNKNDILFLRFEDMKKNPKKAYLEICKKYYPLLHLKSRMFGFKNFNPINDKVGLKPNAAKINSWENLFNEDDLTFFYSQIPHKKFLYEE
ncbi:sulfotransferase domain-containing protein [Lacinutrix sp. MEBiC02404]